MTHLEQLLGILFIIRGGLFVVSVCFYIQIAHFHTFFCANKREEAFFS
jgi:hypothetical protein